MAEIPLEALVPKATGPVATVYLVAPRPGGRTCVVKVYPQALDRRTYQEIELEQAKLAGLRSVASVVLVESLDELPDGRTGLRMELCPQSLPELVAHGPLPIGDVVVLGQILSSVLAEAHEIGLVHGGVTPGNVVERASGQPALSDFGLALRLRFPRDLTDAAAYTAPEVLRDGGLSEHADVYGLGAVLHLALTGRSPFPAKSGETPDDVVLRVLREPAPAVTGRKVPAVLSSLLTRMMAKDPGDRPEAAEVLREFEALLSAEPESDDLDIDDFNGELAAARGTQSNYVQTAPRSPIEPVAQPEPRKRWQPSGGLLVGAGVTAALCAVVAVLLMPGGSEQSSTPPAPQVQPQVTPQPTPTQTIASSVRLVLKPPKDDGTSVRLEWTSSKPLTYAVNIAEQGGKKAQTTYRGTRTSTTVTITPGLKYCFEVQGTDGTAVYVSAPQPLRGATCKR